MGRTSVSQQIDPATGKPMPPGVLYRGPSQYRARKLVDGRRITKIFVKASLAARWLAEVEVDRQRGVFVDRTEAQKTSLGDIIRRYQDEIPGDDSEKRGAEKERGHLKIMIEDPVCSIRMALLASADLAKFRDRLKALDYAPATIVRRLDTIGGISRYWTGGPSSIGSVPVAACHRARLGLASDIIAEGGAGRRPVAAPAGLDKVRSGSCRSRPRLPEFEYSRN